MELTTDRIHFGLSSHLKICVALQMESPHHKDICETIDSVDVGQIAQNSFCFYCFKLTNSTTIDDYHAEDCPFHSVNCLTHCPIPSNLMTWFSNDVCAFRMSFYPFYISAMCPICGEDKVPGNEMWIYSECGHCICSTCCHVQWHIKPESLLKCHTCKQISYKMFPLSTISRGPPNEQESQCLGIEPWTECVDKIFIDDKFSILHYEEYKVRNEMCSIFEQLCKSQETHFGFVTNDSVALFREINQKSILPIYLPNNIRIVFT
jgi:hypothetical protein